MAGISFTVHTDGLDAIAQRMAQAATPAEHLLALQVKKDTEQYVPALTLSLSNRTRVDGNRIIYPGPYARYLYYGKVMVNAITGKGPALIPEVGYRYKKGTRLKATERDLDIKRTTHKNAQAHWFEASKAQNLDKWKRIAAEALIRNGK